MTVNSKLPLQLSYDELGYLLGVIACKIGFPVEKVLIAGEDCREKQAAKLLTKKLEQGKGCTVLYVNELYDVKTINKLAAVIKRRFMVKNLIVASPVCYSRWMLDK